MDTATGSLWLGNLPAAHRQAFSAASSGACAEVDCTRLGPLDGGLLAAALVGLDRSAAVHPLGVGVRGLAVTGQVDLRGQILRRPLNLRFLGLPAALLLDRMRAPALTVAGNPGVAPANCQISMSAVRVNGDLVLEDLRFNGGVNVDAARIDGDFLLRNCEINRPQNRSAADRGRQVVYDVPALSADRARIRGRVRIQQTEIKGLALFRDSRVGSIFRLADVRLVNANSIAFCADGIRIGSNLSLWGDTRIAGQFRMVNACVDGNADFAGTAFDHSPRPGGAIDLIDEAVVLYRLRVRGDLDFGRPLDPDTDCHRQTTSNGCINLLAAEVGGDLRFDGASIKCPHDSIAFVGDELSVTGKVSFEAFTASGTLRLSGATIKQGVTFAGANLSAANVALYARGADISGNLLFLGLGTNAPTAVVGIIDLNQCKIGERLIFRSFTGHGGRPVGETARHTKCITLDEAEIGEHVQLGPDPVHAGSTMNVFHGKVSMIGASIGGNLVCTGARFALGHQPPPTPVSLNLARAAIEGDLIWRIPDEPEGVVLTPTEAASLVQRLQPSGDVRLSQARVGRIWDDARCWPKPGKLRIEGFTYSALHADNNVQIRQRLQWLGLQKERSFYFSLQPYEHLARLYREYGEEEPARMVAIAKQDAQRRGLSLSSHDTWMDQVRQTASAWWKTLLCLTAGYGYRPLRAFGLLAALVGVGTIIFTIFDTQCFYPVGAWQYPWDIDRRPQSQEWKWDTRQSPPTPGVDLTNLSSAYVSFRPFVYAVDLVVPALDLGQEKYWEVRNDRGDDAPAFLDLRWLWMRSDRACPAWMESYVVFHKLLGHLLVILLVLSPTTLLRKD